MRSEPELVAAANESYLGSYRTLVRHSPAGEIREVGGVFAFRTGLPLSLFNGCVVVEKATAPQLETALDWVGNLGLPHRLWVAEELASGLGDVALARGYQRDPVPYPGMVLHPPPVPPAQSAGVTVVPVGELGLDEYHQVSVEGGLSVELARQLISPSLAADPDVQLFIGRLDGRAVGTSIAIRSGDVSGVYAVGTLPAARRRGVGTALTWSAVAAGRAWGCDTVVLQASEMGLPMYKAMGFRTVVTYAQFSRARAV
jgi:GNAT superfamily N-acetyltransferase